MPQKRRVLATVISYNRRDQLANTLEAILGQQGAYCDVMVIDNGSTDGSKEMVADRFTERGVEFCDLGVNTGCAGGIYLAAREGILRNYDCVWIMDDDVVPNLDALSELMRVSEKLDSWGFLSSAAYWKDGSLSKANIQKKDVFRFVTESDYDSEKVNIIMASICSLFLNVNAVKDVGLPIADYFFYTEDYEFTSRLAKHYPCYLVPSSRVFHDMKVNAKASIVNDTEDRMWRYKYLYRNDVNCYSKLGVPGIAYLVCKGIYTGFDIMLRSPRGERFNKLSVLINGYKDGLRFKPELKYL